MDNITLTLGDLGLMLLWAALLVLIGYLVMALKRLNDTLKDVREILGNNKENIDNTLSEIPSIAKNIDAITGEVSHDVRAVRDTIDTITEKSGAAAKSLTDTDSIITGLTAIIQMALFIKNFWSNTFTEKRGVL